MFLLNSATETTIESSSQTQKIQNTQTTYETSTVNGTMTVHFIDVGQADTTVEFYAPLEDEYSDMNDYSICARITFGEIDIRQCCNSYCL